MRGGPNLDWTLVEVWVRVVNVYPCIKLYFSYIKVVSRIVGGNRIIPVIDKNYCIRLYRVHPHQRRESYYIYIDCIGGCEKKRVSELYALQKAKICRPYRILPTFSVAVKVVSPYLPHFCIFFLILIDFILF